MQQGVRSPYRAAVLLTRLRLAALPGWRICISRPNWPSSNWRKAVIICCRRMRGVLVSIGANLRASCRGCITAPVPSPSPAPRQGTNTAVHAMRHPSQRLSPSGKEAQVLPIPQRIQEQPARAMSSGGMPWGHRGRPTVLKCGRCRRVVDVPRSGLARCRAAPSKRQQRPSRSKPPKNAWAVPPRTPPW